MIFNILDNTTELWLTKYIIGEIFSSSGATLYRNPSDQTVCTEHMEQVPAKAVANKSAEIISDFIVQYSSTGT